jgi:hypothetical protein
LTGSSTSSESGSGASSGYGSRVLKTKHWKKYMWNFFFFSLSKTAIYLSLGLLKGHPSYRRGLQPSKDIIQHLKI